MHLYQYHELNPGTALKAAFEKVTGALRAGDFRAADVKKMVGTPYYRARLNDADRLIFRFARYDGQTCLLLLELIVNHAYDKSKFLRGVAAAEPTTAPVLLAATEVPDADVETLAFVAPAQAAAPGKKPPANVRFHLLDRPLFFDDDQQAVFDLPPPLIIIGSAGSGKTALTLEKLKTLTGTAAAPAHVLYVTRSPYLVENAARLYAAHHAPTEAQEVDFLSLQELLEGIRIPQGQEITYRRFSQWFAQHRPYSKVKDGERLFEEFHGVLTGFNPTKPYLTLADYEGLGARQSVFPAEERADVYALFTKYLDLLTTEQLFNPNIAAVERLNEATAAYDFLVVDEVQDLTNAQLALILRTLKPPKKGSSGGNFILCGDSHQVVHPNFFSWAGLKALFFQHDPAGSTGPASQHALRILRTNYRNSSPVTDVANRLLRIKNLRFGSLDRESTFLVEAASHRAGEVVFLKETAAAQRHLNERIRRSMRFAVVVLREEDKAEARRHFDTPLLFSVQEAKGLEYENIVLVNLISGQEKLFREVAEGIDPADVTETAGDLRYGRADRTDRQGEQYKFFINALYVALTRAMQNLYVVERLDRHALLPLLGLTKARDQVALTAQTSTADEWRHEARKLELQGKTEQAASIRQQILGQKTPTWPILSNPDLPALFADALDPARYNKKAKDRLFEYALIYEDHAALHALGALTGPMKYNAAARPNLPLELRQVLRKRYQPYLTDSLKDVAARVAQYGPDVRDEYGLTPLHAAVQGNAPKIIEWLRAHDANPALPDAWGRTPWQLVLQRLAKEPPAVAPYLATFHGLLAPAALHLRLQGQAIKLRADQLESTVVQYLLFGQLPLLRRKLTSSGYWRRGFVEAADIEELARAFPDALVPPHRKARPYINALLARHEINRRQLYGQRLWFRVKNGHYLLNPSLEIEVAPGEWCTYGALLPRLLGGAGEGFASAEQAMAFQYQAHAERRGLKLNLSPLDADDETDDADDDDFAAGAEDESADSAE